jgi:hypothetical protein
VPSEPLAAAASHNIVELEKMLQGHEEGLQPPVVLRAASIGIQALNLNQCCGHFGVDPDPDPDPRIHASY